MQVFWTPPKNNLWRFSLVSYEELCERESSHRVFEMQLNAWLKYLIHNMLDVNIYIKHYYVNQMETNQLMFNDPWFRDSMEDSWLTFHWVEVVYIHTYIYIYISMYKYVHLCMYMYVVSAVLMWFILLSLFRLDKVE